MPDVQVLYIVTAIVLGGLILWVLVALFVAPTAPDESGLQPRDPDPRDPNDGKGKPKEEKDDKKGELAKDKPPQSQKPVARVRVPPPLDETPAPAVVDVISPSEKALAVAIREAPAPVVVLPVMRHRLDSHSEIRDGAPEGPIIVLPVSDEPSGPPLSLVSAVGRGDPGKAPAETSAIIDRHRLFLLADGLGRKVQHELASAVVVDALVAAFSADTDDVFPSDPSLPPRADRLRRSALAAHATFKGRADAEAGNTNWVPMRLLAAHFAPDNRRLYVAATGPDRAYRLRNGDLVRLTKPTRDSDPGEAARVDVVATDTAPDDIYIFGSDAAFGAIGEDLRHVLTYDSSVERLAALVVEAATRLGKASGMTAIVVRLEPPTPSQTPPGV
jgi:serine/threonine protein phosphatase PrpC